MLLIKRLPGQGLAIGQDIHIRVEQILDGHVRLRITDTNPRTENRPDGAHIPITHNIAIDIDITSSGHVALGIHAPHHIPILRDELRHHPSAATL